ncbi:MAG: family 43 glycosylhydrolase [Lachnospiraceae bacterium]|nr:family 43 glycosylhydrolase [Lachnospiraceae bacterium]
MKKYFCNPINMDYLYQFIVDFRDGAHTISREAADPSMILFQGKYYIFASMTLGVWASEDLVSWENHRLPEELPLYDYAPDVRVVGDYVYLSASKRGEICDFYRTRDVVNGPYEKIPGTFDFWDPDLFLDNDGRLYFYWGCSNITPIWGVELDRDTMQPKSERIPLIYGNAEENGYERFGDEHSMPPLTEEEIDVRLSEVLKEKGMKSEDMDAQTVRMVRGFLSQKPYIEGAWMTKKNGKYYLQYACPGTECNIYGDGVYESDSPLGPFVLAKNNPYSYKPGGFMPGAGHGSTMEDRYGNLWHTATMSISRNHAFERRVGIWPAGFDQDGVLFCNQRYGDWPMHVAQDTMDPWKEPDWFLLGYGRNMTASSFTDGKGPEKAADENARTWWQASGREPGEWLMMDLGAEYQVHAVQVNFADDPVDIPFPENIDGERIIDGNSKHRTRWILEGSLDGDHLFILKDCSRAETNLPHDFWVIEEGRPIRYLKLTILEVPYGQPPCIAGLRVFGKGSGDKPAAPVFDVERSGDLDMDVTIREQENTVGYNILWGFAPNKLYHSYIVFDTHQTVGALVKGQSVYVRVDAFNENGITEGDIVREVK